MGDNLDGIFYINLVIMGAIFVGATILTVDTIWTRTRREAAKRNSIQKKTML